MLPKEIVVFFKSTFKDKDGNVTKYPPKIVNKKGFDGFGGVYRVYTLKEEPIKLPKGVGSKLF